MAKRKEGKGGPRGLLLRNIKKYFYGKTTPAYRGKDPGKENRKTCSERKKKKKKVRPKSEMKGPRKKKGSRAAVRNT